MPKKFTDLAELTALDDADVVAVVDTSANTSKKITLQTLRQLITPAGIVTPYAGTTAPTGWLMCDGSAVSRATYAALYTAIGTAYGAGDGTTTFNLPDAKGRVIVSRDSGQTEFDVLGETGGSNTHSLANANLPRYSGSVSFHGGGSATILSNATGSGVTAGINRTSYRAGGGDIGGANSKDSFALNIGQTTPTPISNIQPYLVTNYIIKA